MGGAIQTQILGFSAGTTVVDKNCERIKLSRSLYDMGMKVAAVSMMCQDKRVWDAMRMAGTPCPYEGMIGEDAAEAWKNNPNRAPKGSMRWQKRIGNNWEATAKQNIRCGEKMYSVISSQMKKRATPSQTNETPDNHSLSHDGTVDSSGLWTVHRARRH